MKKEIRIDIYIPPSYFLHKKRQYPVLFFNDGQDMDAVQLVETLEKLYREKSLPELLVFAFYPHDRIQEYGTKSTLDYAGRGKHSEAYQYFLTKEYFPKIKEEYRLSDKREQRAIAGFSLGGLSAFDTAWHHSDIFGIVGVFSGALWWRSKAFIENDPDADRVVHDYATAAEHAPNLRYWLQTGTKDETEDRNKNGIIDSIDDTTDLIKILKRKGIADKNIRYVEVQDGEHNPQTWGEVLPDFLKWSWNS